jgi:hypothetical protein
MSAKKVQQKDVFLPVEYDLPAVAALQAVMAGTATPDQQQRAMTWIIYKACGTYDLDYRTEPRDHAFASGRRFVGLQIVKLMKLNKAILKEKE